MSTSGDDFVSLGMVKKIIQEGQGDGYPAEGHKVTIHYTGKFEDGEEFIDTHTTDSPLEFTLGDGSAIKGWELGIKTMKRNEIAEFSFPPELAYGEEGSSSPKIPPNSSLTYTIELVDWTCDKPINQSEIDEDEEVSIERSATEKKNEDDEEESEEESEEEDIQVKRKAKRIEDDEEDEEEEDENDDEENEDGDLQKKNIKESNEVAAEEEEEEEEDDEDEEERSKPVHRVYDFDIMMAKKKEENSRKKRRRGYDIINDNDDIIADIINQMKDAVEADNEANRNKIAATRKLKLLPFVLSQLRKVDLRDAFLDSDVLSVITEWLAPLPDKSLPHFNIRENLLKILIDFNLYDVDRIKASGIGKAIMYLYKHPKETKENKQRAKQLISCWSRPIFQLDSSFSSISREEREQRDLELMSKQRATKHNDSSDGEPGPSGGSKKLTSEPAPQKPGDIGWIPRARVPAPSMRDYVVRPRSKVDGDVGKSSKRPSNMLEKYMKNQQDRKRANRQQRAINMKIDRV